MPSSIDRLDGTNAVQRTAFLYGPDHARTRQTISPMSGEVAGSPTTTIWYGGAIEKEIDTVANTTTIRTVLPAQLGFIEEKFSGTAPAPTADGARNLRYFLTDHLGSTLAEMDQAQAVLQRMSYDAWGRRRNADGSDDGGPQWGSLKNAQDHSGYTGHEHLDQLGLVNMNARMYDPLLGRHTSADPTVPDPANAQAFNRYSYVLNNALVFTDPTGLAPGNSTNGLLDRPCSGSLYCNVNGQAVGIEQKGPAGSGLLLPSQDRGVRLGENATPPPPPANSKPPPVAPAPAAGAPSPKTGEKTPSRINMTIGRAAFWAADKLDDFQNSDLGHAVQALPPEGAAAGTLKGAMLFVSRLTKADEVAAGVVKGVGTIDTASVRFSQDSVKATFRNGMTLNEAAEALRAGGAATAAQYPPIRLFERNGQFFTLDNRRLLVFSEAGLKVPFRMATNAEISKEFSTKFTTTAVQGWGQFTTVRP